MFIAEIISIKALAMASHATHSGQLKSLHKRGLITDKQLASKMAKLDVIMPPEIVAAPDPQMAAAVAPAAAAQIPVTASVPGDPNADGDVKKPQQPPAA